MYFHSRSNLIEEVYVIAWSVCIRRFSGLCFPAFGLNTETTDVPSGNYLETQSRVGEHIWQRVPNPALIFYEGRPILLTNSFSNFVQIPIPRLFLLPCFFGWMCHHASVHVLFCLMILWYYGHKLVQPWYLRY